MSAMPVAVEDVEEEEPFDFAARVDALRGESTGQLRRIVEEARREQERWRLEELAATRVLDDRGALDPLPDAQRSARTVRAQIEVARRLDVLPEIAAAAHAGEISWDQLQPLVELATAESDAEWARRGPRCAPADLHRMARRSRQVSTAEADARREARSLRMWRRPEVGMFSIRGELADLDGVLAEAVFERMIDRMRPPTGQTWETRAHRMADAFMELCRNYADADAGAKGRSRPLVMVQIPAASGAPEINGMAIAKQTPADYLADTPPRITPQLIDDRGGLVPTSDIDQDTIPAPVRRFVLARDTHCRTPGCERTHNLDVHHMHARCTGGNHDPDELVAICKPCHPMYEPHGPYRLVGDPNQPDGLRLVHRDDPDPDDPPRDGPSP